LAIALVSVFGLVLQDDSVRESVVDKVIDALPVDAAGREDVEEAIEKIARPASAAGLVGLLVFLWAASGMMGAIRRGLEVATGVVEGRPLVRSKLVDLALVGATALLVLLSTAVAGIANLVNPVFAAAGFDGDVLEGALSVGLRLALWIANALLLYRFVPAAGLRRADALAGAIVTGLLLLAISIAADLVYAKTAEWSLIYGSLTGLLIFLYTVYLYATVVLVGAAFAAEWSRPHPRSPVPLRTRIRSGARSLFVRESGRDRDGTGGEREARRPGVGD
jgi:membrane protein